jgi:glycosyltransferase involved in cell wall biosynthesis
MPVYTSERYVGEAIEAHLNQTYSELELIPADNASTDRTEEICTTPPYLSPTRTNRE